MADYRMKLPFYCATGYSTVLYYTTLYYTIQYYTIFYQNPVKRIEGSQDMPLFGQ